MAKLTMAEMVEQRVFLMNEAERIKKEIAALDVPLIAAMKKAKIRETPAFKNRAFRLSKEDSCDYTEAAYALARKKKVIHLFTPAAKITPTKIATAYKKKHIDLETFQELEKEAINKKTTEGLVKFEVKNEL